MNSILLPLQVSFQAQPEKTVSVDMSPYETKPFQNKFGVVQISVLYPESLGIDHFEMEPIEVSILESFEGNEWSAICPSTGDIRVTMHTLHKLIEPRKTIVSKIDKGFDLELASLIKSTLASQGYDQSWKKVVDLEFSELLCDSYQAHVMIRGSDFVLTAILQVHSNTDSSTGESWNHGLFDPANILPVPQTCEYFDLIQALLQLAYPNVELL